MQVTEEQLVQSARWTKDHSKAAADAGWDMFRYDDLDMLQLQRCDEKEIFPSDMEAIDFVKQKAAAGDEIAQLALELDAYFEPVIDALRSAPRP